VAKKVEAVKRTGAVAGDGDLFYVKMREERRNDF
jgi:hypothetical protein